jgi:hypothetical protein
MKRTLLFLLAYLFTLNFISAQCRAFIKKSCLPGLAPYSTNGQINTAVFAPGDHAEMPLTFKSEQNYRVIVCSQEILGKVIFKLKDLNGKVLFNNAEHEFKNTWDFKVEGTQQYKLEIEVPNEKTENGLMHTACVSIIIGYKKN